MNTLARSFLTIPAAILALAICSLAPAQATADPNAVVLVASSVSAVATSHPGYDAYALLSPFDYGIHNCPQESCGTVDQCGPPAHPGSPCGTLPGCTCKKCHNWGVCTQN